MANRKRAIPVKFYMTEQERALLSQKLAQAKTRNLGAYLRKMAIDGYIVYVDTADIREMNRELSAISRSINQIAKRVNATGSLYEEDMAELKERMADVWQLQRRILSALP